VVGQVGVGREGEGGGCGVEVGYLTGTVGLCNNGAGIFDE